jgi:hypothetical protein
LDNPFWEKSNEAEKRKEEEIKRRKKQLIQWSLHLPRSPSAMPHGQCTHFAQTKIYKGLFRYDV